MTSPNKRIKILFIAGLVLQTIAQILFPLSNTLNLLEPIDFIHWTLLLGVVLIIPGTLKFSNGTFSKIGLPIAFMGIITQIGMCVLDFVLWSFKDDREARNEFVSQIIGEPSIWSVFITVGPPLLFIGFIIISYDYFKKNLRGFIITNLGAIIVGIGGLILTDVPMIKIIGYAIFTIGLTHLFIKKSQEKTDRNKLYNVLFIIGLLFEMTGQILLAQGTEFMYAQKPIDFAHWSLLLGVAFMLPQITRFPNKIASYIGTPLAFIGAVCIIGMCVLDFIWWSYPTYEMRGQFTAHISEVSSIWKPFIKVGPSSYFLNLGLLFLGLNYFKQNKLGVLLIILATLIIFGGHFIPYRLIPVYLITAIGFASIFYKKTSINE